MKTYRVRLHAGAYTAITVTVPEDADGEELTKEAAIDAAYNQTPSLCAQCSGWGQAAGVELGEWELDDEPDAVEEVDQ